MTAASTNPADSVVFITSLLTPATATTPALYEQGSGVLIAPDEVLTAAHVVYGSSGNLLTGTLVSPGYQSSVVYGVAAADTIHAEAFTDFTQLSGTQSDFALIHLSTPITDVPVMALGADFAGGMVTVTGYPAATSGLQDSVTENVTQVSGYNAFQGTALGAPGDAHGASGGPVWETVNGVATVVGLTSSETGTTGNFVQLTSSDVAQIQAWIAQDHAATAVVASTTAVPQSMSGTMMAAATSTAQTTTDAQMWAATPATTNETIEALARTAWGMPAVSEHGLIQHATDRLVTLLQHDNARLGAGASFDDVASDALSQLTNHPGHGLAASLLQGVIAGHDGGAVSDLVSTLAAAQDPHVFAATAGYHLGHTLSHNGF